MNDRELLELAAKAAGHEWKWDQARGSKVGYLRIREGDRWPMWKPETDDGDNSRLGSKLRICILWQHDWVMAYSGATTARDRNLTDRAAAQRRAVLGVAAEIGRSMS